MTESPFNRKYSNAEISALNEHIVVQNAVKNAASRKRAKAAKLAKLLRESVAVIDSHVTTLTSKHRQCENTGEYGEKEFDENKWTAAKNYFIRAVLLENFTVDELPPEKRQIILGQIDCAVEKQERKRGKSIATLSPIEFEQYCADTLASLGWTVALTKKSGDQGVDVIARKNVSVAIQCKKYSSSVGNSAVQEAISGREFICADFGAVVTTGKYTKSARQLAAATRVILLQHTELGKLDALIALACKGKK